MTIEYHNAYFGAELGAEVAAKWGRVEGKPILLLIGTVDAYFSIDNAKKLVIELNKAIFKAEVESHPTIADLITRVSEEDEELAEAIAKGREWVEETFPRAASKVEKSI